MPDFRSLQMQFCIALSLTSLSCKSAGPAEEKVPADDVVTIRIDASKTYQTIRHFGASDAWSGQFVGNWPDAKRNAIADLLFSSDSLQNGKLKGIGLSLWRFNAGAGTAEQGDASGIRDEWRRAESFMGSDGGYDWNKQAGQLWLLNAARERGIKEFLLFPNSPPVQLTVNGKGYADNGQPNLHPDKFGAFGKYLADIVTGIQKKTGITFNYISPTNEPQWDWSDGGQEGTPFFNNQIAALTRSLSSELLRQKLDTKITIAEAGQIDYLYSDHNKPGRGSQFKAFFDPQSTDFVGNLSNVIPAVSGHSYFTTSPSGESIAKRRQVAAGISAVRSGEYWMSEYCILGDNAGEIEGNGRDLGMDAALYVARVIHQDLVYANASAWHWWVAISPYNYKDGLIYIDKNKTDGNYYPAKMLWALGNYSRFVRPGAVRLAATSSLPDEQLPVSVYKNTDGKLVAVVINAGIKPQKLRIQSQDAPVNVGKIYQTSQSSDMESATLQNTDGTITVPQKSIATILLR